MPFGGQSLVYVQIRKIGGELSAQLPSGGDFSDQLDFAPSWDQGFCLADHDRIFAESGVDVIYLHRKIRSVPGIPSDGRDIPFIGSLASGGDLRSNQLADVTVIRFPMEIRRGHVQLFYPEL